MTSHLAEAPAIESLALFPTRAAEARALAADARPGRPLLLTGHPGVGRTTVIIAAANSLGLASPAPFNCGHRSTAAQLVAWFEESIPRGIALLDDVERLPDALAGLLADMVIDSRLTVLMAADTAALRATSEQHGASEALNDLWHRRLVMRQDLAPLGDNEITARLRRENQLPTLDALQEATLVRTASGSLSLIRDLMDDVAPTPDRVPRLLPRAWTTGFTLSARTLHHVASRHRDLTPELRMAAILLHQLGPLAYSTATRLLGPDTVAGLAASEVLQLWGDHEYPTASVSSVVAAALLSECPSTGLAEQRERHIASLLRLWKNGIPQTDATALVLARHLLDGETIEDPQYAPLLTQAAKKSSRHGEGPETEALLRVARRLDPRPDSLSIRWRALHLQGQHHASLVEAQELLATDPANFGLDHLYQAAIAASWVNETPQWLSDHLDRIAASDQPALAHIFRMFMGDSAPVPATFVTLQAYGLDHGQTPAVRLWALSLCITAHMGSGDLEALQLCVDAGRSLRGQLLSHGEPSGCLEQEALLSFDVSCASSQILAGLDAHGVRRVTTSRTEDVITFGATSGRFPSACAAYLHAVDAYHRGDRVAAKANITTAMSMLNRSTFSTANAYMSILSLELASGGPLGSLDPELLGAHLGVARQVHQRVAPSMDYLASALQPNLGEAPLPADHLRSGWALLAQAHHRVLAGGLDAGEVLKELPQQIKDLTLPSSKAILHHLQALADDDPEALSVCAEELLLTGKTAAARAALEHARLIFLSRRAAARANDCSERLADLPIVPGTITAPSAPPHLTPRNQVPAGLTQREHEICQLVAAGLTNGQIGERLFLSVRTVESHVLQARSKLRAPRRRDIPERLARLSGHAV